jgi:hypothetical protein
MREIDQVECTLHQGIARRDQGAHPAKHQAINDLLDEYIRLAVIFLEITPRLNRKRAYRMCNRFTLSSK